MKKIKRKDILVEFLFAKEKGDRHPVRNVVGRTIGVFYLACTVGPTHVVKPNGYSPH